MSEALFARLLKEHPFPHPPRPCQLEEACWHEAGHAVANLVLGEHLKEVWVKPTGAGCTVNSTKYITSWIAFVTTLAGPEAERRRFGTAEFSAGDERQVRNASKDLSPAQQAEARRLCEEIIEDHWYAVEAVAVHLMRRRHATHEELIAIMEGSTPNG